MSAFRHQDHQSTIISKPKQLFPLLLFPIVLLLTSSTMMTSAAFPPSLRHTTSTTTSFVAHQQLLPVQLNKITAIGTSCDLQTMNITVHMEHTFKGVVFARDFSQECRTIGTLSNLLSINLPTSGCGVRLNSGEPTTTANTNQDSSRQHDGDRMFYSVTLVIQQDKYLRQITDQERTVYCYVENNTFIVRSKPMEEVVKDELVTNGSHRMGRMKEEGWSKDDIIEEESKERGELGDALSNARAWMEIMPVQENTNPGTIQVGEQTLLLVKSTLPAGIGWQVVECSAHDGLGESSQKLLDEFGCPVDELLLPALLKGPAKPIALMRHQEAVAKFAAFKFPDRDRLHLSCGLQLCRGICQRVDCNSINEHKDNNNSEIESLADNRLGRKLQKGEAGEILDRLEVFNSVEVLAPGIELEDLRQSERLQSDYLGISSSSPTAERTFCVSPDKMAVTLCVLGLVFILAVVVAVGALYRGSRASGGGGLAAVPYYTRSLFSSGSTGGSSGNTQTSGSYGGSKLLLHESPCLGQSAASMRGLVVGGNNGGYGRIL